MSKWIKLCEQKPDEHTIRRLGVWLASGNSVCPVGLIRFPPNVDMWIKRINATHWREGPPPPKPPR